MDSTLQPPVEQVPKTFIVQRLIDQNRWYFGGCPYAQTLTAHSITHGAQILFILPCRRWSCPVCSQQKIRRLAGSVRAAKPNRLLTLTIDPALYESPRGAFLATAPKVPLLVRKLRQRYGEVEYLRVTEVTKSGWPHYHLLVRSGFLPHAVVKTLWDEMTGAKIVDLRQVTKSFAAYQYLVKYLSKLHKLEWTERHVSVSRHFIPPDDWENPSPVVYGLEEFHNYHPAAFVAERCEGATLERLTPHSYLIHPANASSPNAPTVELPGDSQDP